MKTEIVTIRRGQVEHGLPTTKEIENELYSKLGALELKVEAVKRLNLSLRQLDHFYEGINSLMKKHAGWFGEIN